MSISFTINGQPFTVSPDDLPVDITLNTFIREHAHLSGTKFMCLEGGCGVCICVIKGHHPVSNELRTWSTNSCLTLLNVCEGWDIVTIEGIGNRKDGYHPIQTRVAHLNGSQCGYCSPGMVMNMYALLESKGQQLSMVEVENSFGGNICRCTGYRPILDAMKSFSADYEYEYVDICRDIEDIGKICQKTGSACAGKCRNEKLQMIYKNGSRWFSAKSLKDVFDAFGEIGDKVYMLVAGNTAHGVYRRTNDIEFFIDTNKVPELHANNVSGDSVELGGNLNLTEAMDIFSNSSKNPGFEYLQKIYNHFDLIANIPVRNMGTLAGNLSIKHSYKEFPSDVFIILEGVDAKIVIAEDDSKTTTVSPQQYLSTDMKKKVIKSIILGKYPESDFLFNSYKIMPRAQNAHAFVNGAFLIKAKNGKVESARLCFGGINPNFIHASKTEKFLEGKDLFDNETLQGAMDTLQSELDPDWILPDAAPDFRKVLACGLFYKFVLGYAPEGKSDSRFRSGGSVLKRELSSGIQTYETRSDVYPITEPVIKVEALAQCSGEAKYMNDYPNLPNQLWAAFVHATEAKAKIAKIDATEALKVDGVVTFYSVRDILGKNTFVVKGMAGYPEEEELFCEDVVKYHSQAIGMVVAQTAKIAEYAAKLVKVMYEKLEGPIIPNLAGILEHKAFDRIKPVSKMPKESQSNGTPIQQGSKKIKGSLDVGGQYHFTMEPHTTVCIPTEDGIDVYAAVQWMDLCQTAIANVIDAKVNSIRMHVRRLGGGYGTKISRGCQAACACALACKLLNRPIRFVQTIESMMSSIGKRFACHSDYEAEVDDKGKIHKLQNIFVEDAGYTSNEDPVGLSVLTAKSCYETNSNWKVEGSVATTDATSHTWCRAPGAVEGIAMIETIMEHISRETKLDPVDVRMVNIAPGNKLATLLPEYMTNIEYKARKQDIENFNKQNRWKKKGLGVAIMEYPIGYFGMYPVAVSIYHGDGTVGVCHGGIEMGQGINTKVAQVTAYTLGLSLDMIKIEPSDSFVTPNSTVTGGAIGSESVCYAARKACEKLLEKLKPVKATLNKDASWQELISAAYKKNINLSANSSVKNGDLKSYSVYGIACSEVEIDILTGNLILKRVDILEDSGESLSPMIDVGQVEGGFMMGLGYWLTEKLIYDSKTGELLTTRTWNYKPPGAKDIPVDFRVNLLQKSPNPAGFLRSKTTGEPPTCLAICAAFAIRNALDSARTDAGINETWFHLGAPTTTEDIVLMSGNSPDMFKLSC